jgi:hypothetical protein
MKSQAIRNSMAGNIDVVTGGPNEKKSTRIYLLTDNIGNHIAHHVHSTVQ